LESYRSEFFGRLRSVLGGRTGVRVVGDRFVFQSDVFFDPASAQLSDEAVSELGVLASTLQQIASEIPTDLPWLLRVDGHTDRRPISNERFPSNWDLSAARAIAVVNFLVTRGVPGERLAAAGLGQHHPIDDRQDEIGYRRNRRIELRVVRSKRLVSRRAAMRRRPAHRYGSGNDRAAPTGVWIADARAASRVRRVKTAIEQRTPAASK
jgi:chemotaxis protein MotB